MKIQKHCVGIDISKSTFTACICSEFENQDLRFSEVKTYSNDKIGFNQLNRWVRKLVKDSAPMVYLMEATKLNRDAYLLKLNVSVPVCFKQKNVLPNGVIIPL